MDMVQLGCLLPAGAVAGGWKEINRKQPAMDAMNGLDLTTIKDPKVDCARPLRKVR
jgi:hypothetical protein